MNTECDKDWAYGALEHLRDPDVLFADIESGKVQATPGQRRRALGTAAHGVLEDWYAGRQPNWESVPGRLALSGAHKLPAPGECKHATEFTLGDTPYTYRYKGPDGAWIEESKTVLVLDGIKILAKVDLRAWDITPSERARLDLPERVTVDHKTTRTFTSQTTREGVLYCAVKTPEELCTDYAAGVYALDDMRVTGADLAHMRWVYYKAEGPPDARAVNFIVTRAQAEDTAARMVKRAKHLDLITSVAEAEPNFDQCPKFGGCSRHVSKGGPCTAQRPITSDIFGGHSGAPLTAELFGGFSGEPIPMTMPAFDPTMSLADRIKQIQAGTLPGLVTAPAPVVAPVVAPAPGPVVLAAPLEITTPPAPVVPPVDQVAAAPAPAPLPVPAPEAPKPSKGKGVTKGPKTDDASATHADTDGAQAATVTVTVTGSALAVRKAFGELT